MEAPVFFGSLFCITEGQLLVCTLGRAVRTVPRRVNLPGSATKLAYSEHLRCLIVAYSNTEFDTAANPVRRYTRATIEFVDPDAQSSTIEPASTHRGQTAQSWRPCGAAGEKITCIKEWMPRKGNDLFHFILVTTSRKHQGGLPRGRVIFLLASRNASDPSRIECSVKHIHKFENPVYAIAAFGPSTLIVATGYEIVPLENEPSDLKFERGARYTLLSPAVSITVSEPYIYISTARESLIVLKAVDGKLVLHAHDRMKREGLSHVHLPAGLEDVAPKLTLASSKGGTVSVLSEEGVTERDKLLPVALSEAHLALSVTKLHCQAAQSTTATAFYGTTIDGTVYRFDVLREAEMRLFKFLQTLAVRDTAVCAFTPRRKRQSKLEDADLPDSHFKPTHTHVDGDILLRLLSQGVSHLRSILDTTDAVDLESPPPRGAVPKGPVFERFLQLARPLCPRSTDLVADVIAILGNKLG